MSLWIDTMFAKRVGSHLSRFKIKKDSSGQFAAAFKCPLCGDSEKHNKIRGSLYAVGGERIVMKCFNCMPDGSMSLMKFLKEIDPGLAKEYGMEIFKELHGEIKEKTETQKFKSVDENLFKTKINSDLKHIEIEAENSAFTCQLTPIANLNEKHPGKMYVTSRKLPEWTQHKMFYVPKFFKWAHQYFDDFNSAKGDHPRLIIPWYSKEGKIFAFQARSFGNEQPKYYTIVLDKNEPKFFGLERLDESKPIYVVEGPIDALCVNNGVAIGNAALLGFDHPNAVYIPDKDIRNDQVMKLVHKMIVSGKKVCMLPHDFPKDLNQALQDGFTSNEVEDIINRNTYSGLSASVHYMTWNKTERK